MKMSKAVKERKRQKRDTRTVMNSVERNLAIDRLNMSKTTKELENRQAMKQFISSRPMGNY
jgi:hypothetical protein